MESSGTGARLVIVCGLPGSGKTTLAKHLESSLHAIRFSPDERLDALSLNLWDEEKREDRGAAVEVRTRTACARSYGDYRMRHLGRSERNALRLGARALGAAVELHYLCVPENVLFERIQRRGLESPPIKRDTLSRWFDIFQVPTADEMALFDKPLIANLASG